MIKKNNENVIDLLNKPITTGKRGSNDSKNNDGSIVYLSPVSEKFISKENIKSKTNVAFTKVYIPNASSERGGGYFYVESKNKRQLKDKNGVPQRGCFEINLGNANENINYFIPSEDDTVEKRCLKVREFVTMWKAKTYEYMNKNPISEIGYITGDDESGNSCTRQYNHSSYVFSESANDKNDGDELDY